MSSLRLALTMVASSWAPPVPSRNARLRWFGLIVAAPLVALALASHRTWNEWRFWDLVEHRHELVLASATYIACLLLLRAVSAGTRPTIPLPPVPYGVVRLACVVVAFGSLLIINDGTGRALTPGFVGSAFPILGLSAVFLVPAVRPRTVRVGLVPSGRLAQLRQMQHAGIDWVDLFDPGETVPLGLDAVAADLHHPLPSAWRTFLADCQLRGIPVVHAGSVYEQVTGRVSLRYLRECALREVEPSRFQMVAKRVGELVLIAIFSPLVAVLGALTALAIRLESPGPVFFVQERVGYRNRVFRMAKFRSMRVGADAGGPAFAARRDTRVTRVGAVIRRLRIDELPQLYNVVRGDMSLVGPRPEQTVFADTFTREIPFYASRHNVRPGITGWAQVRSGYAAGKEETVEKLEYDLYYVRHLSLWLDAAIVWRSVRTVLSGDGAR